MPVIKRLKDLHNKRTQPYKHENISQKYYNSMEWRELRKAYKISHPLCEECLKNNKITPVAHVHHKIEFLKGRTDEERWSLLLDASNLMSVCLECHRKIHNSK